MIDHEALWEAWEYQVEHLHVHSFNYFIDSRNDEEAEFLEAAVHLHISSGKPLSKCFEELGGTWGTPLMRALR